jgi:hypothetical protein
MHKYENPRLEAKVTYLIEKPMPMRFGNGYRCLLKGLPLPDWMTGGCATDTYINVDDAGYSLFPYFSSSPGSFFSYLPSMWAWGVWNLPVLGRLVEVAKKLPTQVGMTEAGFGTTNVKTIHDFWTVQNRRSCDRQNWRGWPSKHQHLALIELIESWLFDPQTSLKLAIWDTKDDTCRKGSGSTNGRSFFFG